MRLKVGRNNIPVEIFSYYALERLLIPLPGLNRAVICRLRETDPEVFAQVFVYFQYKHLFLPGQAEIIIDAGANVGYSVLFFRQLYPNALIIALEPDPSNFAILQENCADLSNVVLLNLALWHSCTTLQLQVADEAGKSLGSWGTRTIEARQTKATLSTEAVDVPTLMQRFNIYSIDIFKIDIEGAEKEVFADPGATWYEAVKLFTIETHERFTIGSDSAVKNALPLSQWQYARKGENQFFNKKEVGI